MPPGRKREWTEEDREKVLAGKRRGLSDVAIGKELGFSDETIRKIRLSSKPATPPTPIKAPPAPDPADLPPDATLADVERAIGETQEAIAVARDEGNLAAFATLNARLQGWLDRRRKFAPPAPPNPDDNPDMVAAGERAATRLHEMVDKAFPPASAEEAS